MKKWRDGRFLGRCDNFVVLKYPGQMDTVETFWLWYIYFFYLDHLYPHGEQHTVYCLEICDHEHVLWGGERADNTAVRGTWQCCYPRQVTTRLAVQTFLLPCGLVTFPISESESCCCIHFLFFLHLSNALLCHLSAPLWCSRAQYPQSPSWSLTTNLRVPVYSHCSLQELSVILKNCKPSLVDMSPEVCPLLLNNAVLSSLLVQNCMQTSVILLVIWLYCCII